MDVSSEMEEEKAVNRLPEEMRQMIFKNLGSKADLLSLRSVCKRFNLSATEVLGLRAALPEIVWDHMSTPPKNPSHPAPILIVTPTASGLLTIALRPSGNMQLGIGRSNTNFPTKSLSLVIQTETEEQGGFIRSEIGNDALSNLFENYGSLKSLFISGGGISKSELYHLLLKMKELKVLKISTNYSLIVWGIGWRHPPNIPATADPLLPDLKHLTLSESNYDNFWTWLLERIASKLETLEMGYCCSRMSQIWSFPIQPVFFETLKNLKLVFPKKKFIVKGTGVAMKSLERLSIIHANCSVEQILRFISTFQMTLTELTVTMVSESPEEQKGDENDNNVLCFSKLVQLTVLDKLIKKRLLLSKFPKLERLQLLNYFPIMKHEALELCETEGYWGISPTLKTIEWIWVAGLENRVVNNRIITINRKN